MRSFLLTALLLLSFIGAKDSCRCAIAEEPSAKDSAKSNSKPNAAPPKVKITIGKETTYITKPLRPDGYPDYLAAINEISSRGVTPENNAAVLLQQSFGPRDIPEKLRPSFFQKLGISPLPEKGDYFVGQKEIIKRRVADLPVAEQDSARDSFEDQFDQAKLHPWTAADYPIVAEWVKINEKPLQLVIEASRRSKQFFPIIVGDKDPLIGCLLPHDQTLREAAGALTARAMQRAADGKTKDAWQDLMACHRLGRLTSAQTFLVDTLVGYAIEGITVTGDVALAHYAKLSDEELSMMQSDLQKLPLFPMLSQTYDIGERFMYLDAVCRIADHGLDTLAELGTGRGDSGTSATAALKAIGNSMVDWDVPLKMGNQWYDRLVAWDQIKDPKQRQTELRTYNQDLEKLSKKTLDPKQFAWDLFSSSTPKELLSPKVGNTMVVLFLPAMNAVRSARTRTELYDQMDQTALALAMYRNDHGNYPDRLETLVPKYLAKIPDDTFAVDAEKPIHYRREGKAYIMWSVGIDGVDDNARSYDDDPAGDDCVLRPIPAEKKNDTAGH